MYGLLRSILFRMDPERAHDLTIRWLQSTPTALASLMTPAVPPDPVEVMGLTFPNRVGLAAGLDKNGVCIDRFGAMGFGFLEVGTVTPRPQPGNPRPRLFRLPEYGGIINRMGFNNEGVQALVARAEKRTYKGILGINIGKNLDTPVEKAADDYVLCLRAAYPAADYIAVNISSPNTVGLRKLQDTDELKSLVERLKQTQSELRGESGRYVPLAVKIAPDLEPEAVRELGLLLREQGADAVIATNTTINRTAVAGHPLAEEAGGLSGKPVREPSTAVIRELAAALKGSIPIIGVGGIFGGADAREKTEAGASLVQIYSGLIYRGPGLVAEAARALAGKN